MSEVTSSEIQTLGLVEKDNAATKKKFLARNISDELGSTTRKLKERTRKTTRKYRPDRFSRMFRFEPYFKSQRPAHCGLKRYTCRMCGSSLWHKHMLKNAGCQEHIGEKLYMCDCCASTSDLSLHADKVFQSKVCKTFTTDQALKLLLRVRKKVFKCSVCCQGFAAKISLKAHMEEHQTWKPHQCDVCSKRFFHESSLDEHSHKHVSERHLKCEMCGKVYLYYGGLMIHMGRHGTSDSITFESDTEHSKVTERGT